MKRCEHTNCFHSRAARVTYGEGVDAAPIDHHHITGEPILSVMIEARICQRCGAWLSLGPSNDDSDAVRIEVRAAEIVQRLAVLEGSDEAVDRALAARFKSGGLATDECYGWAFADRYLTANDVAAPRVMSHDGLAGYLARAIATHEETP